MIIDKCEQISVKNEFDRPGQTQHSTDFGQAFHQHEKKACWI